MKKNYMMGLMPALLCMLLLLDSCTTARKVVSETEPVPPPLDTVQTTSLQAVQEMTVVEYCKGAQYQTDEEFFRASAVGESSDLALSQKKAMSNARAEMVSSIETLMKGVTDSYTKSAELNNKEEVMERFETKVLESTEQVLSGVVKICEKTTKDESGRYLSYVAIEMAKINMINSIIDRISKDEMLRIDFNHKMFEDTFNKEIESLESKRKGE